MVDIFVGVGDRLIPYKESSVQLSDQELGQGPWMVWLSGLNASL